MKKKTFAKIFSAFLAVVMMLCSAPLSGFTGIIASAETLSGTCGDNVNWSLDRETGVLDITGTGAMYDYTSSSDSRAPWYQNIALVKSVKIDKGVTSISNYAFYYCQRLVSIEIPDSVTSIGNYAFCNCYSLTSVIIPDGVISIGDRAFNWCEDLTSVIIPDSVTVIGSYAFNYCSKLVSIEIPDSVTVIGGYAFYWCSSLTSVDMSAKITTINYGAFDGCKSLINVNYSGSESTWADVSVGDYNENLISSLVFECDSENPYRSKGSCGENLTYVVTLDGELVITGTGAMTDFEFAYNTPWANVTEKIISVSLPDGITYIGNYTFGNCSSLTSVTIPESVTSIGYGIFTYCYSLEEVNYPGTKEEWKKINGYSNVSEEYLVYECNSENSYRSKGSCGENLTYVVTADGELIITGSGAMNDYVGDSYYGGVAPWSDVRKKITSVSLPEGITHIGNCSFDDCSNLISVNIPDGVTSIGEGAFSSCRALTSVTIPDNVTSIGNEAFSECEALTSVVIPDSVTSIGDYTFSECEALTSVAIGNSVTSIGDNAFYSCEALTSVVIPDSVISIGEEAFYCCEALTSVVIPDSVTSIGDYAFAWCSDLTSVSVDENNNNYTSDEYGVLYNKTKTELIQYPAGNVRETFVVPDSVTSISHDAFHSCESLISVTIPKSVINIGNRAFRYCESLTDVNYPGTEEDWKKVTVGSDNSYLVDNLIYEYNSENPYRLKGSCGDNLTYVLTTDCELVITGSGAMTDYTGSSYYDWYSISSKITSVYLPKGITQIGSYAFQYCYYIDATYYAGSLDDWNKITIGSNNTYLTDCLILECDSENPAYAPGSCGDNLTYTLYTSGELVITGTGDMYNYGSWSNKAPWSNKKEDIKSVTISDGVMSIGDYAFYDCPSLISVTIADTVTHIGKSAFTVGWSTESKLAIVHMSKSIKEIGDDAFYDCNNLAFVVYAGTEEDFNNIVIGDYNSALSTAWYFDTDSTPFISESGFIYFVKDSVATIYDYVGTESKVSIPSEFDGATVKAVRSALFTQSGITSVTIPSTVENIDFAQDYVVPQDDNFKEFIVDENNAYYSSVDGVLFSKDKTELVYCPHGKEGDSYSIPDGTVKLGELAFAGSYYIKTLTIPASVTEIDHGKKNNHAGVGGFSGALEGIRSLENFIVDANNPNYSNDYEGVLYNKDKTELISYPSGKADSEYIVPPYVKKIGNVAFSRANNLEEVIIPEGVTEFGGFYCCENLMLVSIPEGVTVIPEKAFYGCTMLYSVIIPVSVTSIEEDAFFMAGANIILFLQENLQFGYNGTEEDWSKVDIKGLENQEMFAEFIDVTFLGDACEHEYTLAVTKEPTCAEAGETTYTCSLCGGTYTETIAKLAHTSGEAVKENEKEATCTTAASYDSVVYCTVCSVEISRETVETSSALGHTEGEAVIENEVAATPATEGSYDTVVYCTVCNAELSRETTVVPALGHTEGEAVIENEVPATCTSEGSYDLVTYCTCCTPAVELTRETVSVPTVSHTEVTEITEPTCTESGKTVVACSVCGEIISETEIPALGHAEGKAVEENRTEATCTTTGYYDTVVNCSVCGEELSRETKSIPASGHRFGAWQVTTEPTMTENGIKTRTCSVCEKTEKSTVPATGVTAKLTDSQGNVVKEMVFESAGVSSVSMGGIDNGTYTLVISQESYVTRTYTVVATNGIVNAEFKLNKQGDLNGDGRVNTVDVARANAHAKGTSSLSGYEFACVDINGDGRVNTIDVAQMNAHTKGVSTLW